MRFPSLRIPGALLGISCHPWKHWAALGLTRSLPPYQSLFIYRFWKEVLRYNYREVTDVSVQQPWSPTRVMFKVTQALLGRSLSL